ncbi:hypothetical protein BC749_101513 [Flavobacterium araucananum]|nr:hypothetical protein BC749_101513 [Flavobacterium araucananum]
MRSENRNIPLKLIYECHFLAIKSIKNKIMIDKINNN